MQGFPRFGQVPRRPLGQSGSTFSAFILIVALSGLAAFVSLADQIEMKNGDKYSGRVVGVATNAVTLQSEILGTVKIPRAQVLRITLGNEVATVSPVGSPALAATNASPAVPLPKLGSNSNLVEQVQNQFLSDATPEARAKFNELLSGVMTGRLSQNDIRAQAKAVAEQARALQKELGEEAGGGLDTYLAILDKFIGETAGPVPTSTNRPQVRPQKPEAP
jgi:hypothetical protein